MNNTEVNGIFELFINELGRILTNGVPTILVIAASIIGLVFLVVFAKLILSGESYDKFLINGDYDRWKFESKKRGNWDRDRERMS